MRDLTNRLSGYLGDGGVRWRGRRKRAGELPPDFDAETARILNAIRPFTKTRAETIFALVEAVRYVTRHGIEGDLVECGVWQGGASMAMAYALQASAGTGRERHIYLYDTFCGMSQPSDVDINWRGHAAKHRFEALRLSKESSDWCHLSLADVKRNLHSTGFSPDHLHFVEGMVEKTIPAIVPDKIAILRLDTDWYASTKHELLHLFPRVAKFGVVIIDDYGYWQGARKAVDEYIADNRLSLYLHRIDHTGRTIIKPF